MSVKVEIGFTEAGNSAPFLTLDDSVKGLLNNTIFVLGGAEVLVDISEYFRTFNIQRGRSRELEKYNAGQSSITFNNDERVFDPTFEASPFFGQIVPKRQIRVTADDEIQFEGTIEDWNITYDAGGKSVASCQAFDGFSFLTNITLDEEAVIEQRTNQRIESILDTLEWPNAKRDVGFGGATLASATIEPDTNALKYLETVSGSDPGDLFISKNGSIKFVGRNVSFETGGIIFSDDGSQISYQAIGVVYGSELLYNNVTVTNNGSVATATNSVSVGLYGERDLVTETFLKDADEQLEQLANYLVNRYESPEYRIESLTTNLETVTSGQRQQLLQADLGDVVQIIFTPANIAPAINRYAKIIGINQVQNPSEEIISLKFASTDGALFVLGDSVFGRLSEGNSLGW